MEITETINSNYLQILSIITFFELEVSETIQDFEYSSKDGDITIEYTVTTMTYDFEIEVTKMYIEEEEIELKVQLMDEIGKELKKYATFKNYI